MIKYLELLYGVQYEQQNRFECMTFGIEKKRIRHSYYSNLAIHVFEYPKSQ